jgi:hypothetical protein
MLPTDTPSRTRSALQLARRIGPRPTYSRTPYQGTDWADTIRAPMRGRGSVKFKNYFNDSRQ